MKLNNLCQRLLSCGLQQVDKLGSLRLKGLIDLMKNLVTEIHLRNSAEYKANKLARNYENNFNSVIEL